MFVPPYTSLVLPFCGPFFLSLTLCLCISLAECLSFLSISVSFSLWPLLLSASFPDFSLSGGLQAAGQEQMAVRPWPEAHVITEALPSVAFQRPPGKCKLSCHKQAAVTTLIQGLAQSWTQPASSNPERGQAPSFTSLIPTAGPEACLQRSGGGALHSVGFSPAFLGEALGGRGPPQTQASLDHSH